MASLVKSTRIKLLVLLILIPLVLAACGSSTSPSSSGGLAAIHLTVGGKLDTEGQLLAKMYVLLLRKAGYSVTDKSPLGANAVVLSAITSGRIDLYPEYTVTGLTALQLNTSGDPNKDYQTVKQGFEEKYHITWLDKSPLNDTYGICIPKNSAKLNGVTSISQLAPIASKLSVATSPDGVKYAIDVVKSVYNITFGGGSTTYTEEALTFPAVVSGKQDVNVCYTTSPFIPKSNFILLQDDKHAFPVYNPAPVVRDDTLQKAPGIKNALNPLAAYLTTEVSQQLQLQVANGTSVTQVATDFLKSKGLL